MSARAAILKLFPPRPRVAAEPRVLEGVKTDYGVRERIERAAIKPGDQVMLGTVAAAVTAVS